MAFKSPAHPFSNFHNDNDNGHGYGHGFTQVKLGTVQIILFQQPLDYNKGMCGSHLVTFPCLE